MNDILLLKGDKPFKLMDKRKVYIEQTLKKIFKEKRMFTQPQYSLTHLSKEVRLSTNILSAFFNQVLGQNFNEYINSLRVSYFLQMIESEDAHTYTLAGLAENCGFHNRNTFISAFKKIMGQTPSKYIQQLGLKSFSQNKSGVLRC